MGLEFPHCTAICSSHSGASGELSRHCSRIVTMAIFFQPTNVRMDHILEGFVLSIFVLFRNDPEPTNHVLLHVVTGIPDTVDAFVCGVRHVYKLLLQLTARRGCMAKHIHVRRSRLCAKSPT